jgi:hypothetical protein
VRSTAGGGKSILLSNSTFFESAPTPTLPRKRGRGGGFPPSLQLGHIFSLPKKCGIGLLGPIAQNYFKYKMIADRALPDALDFLSL